MFSLKENIVILENEVWGEWHRVLDALCKKLKVKVHADLKEKQANIRRKVILIKGRYIVKVDSRPQERALEDPKLLLWVDL